MDIFNQFQNHKLKLKQYLTNNKNYKMNYDCDLCNKPFYNKSIRDFHNTTQKHTQKIKNMFFEF